MTFEYYTKNKNCSGVNFMYVYQGFSNWFRINGIIGKEVFCRFFPFILNQFWKNLVHIHEIYSWTVFVLCVVFKCQYFMELFKKNWFFTVYIHISKDRNSLKKCSIDLRFFSTCSGDSNKVFLFLESYHFLKFMSDLRSFEICM